MKPQHQIAIAGQSTLQVLLGITVGASLLLVSVLPAASQTTRPTPLEDLQTKDGSDFFNGRGNGQTGSVMNFIQNAIIGTPRSMDEFSAEQQGNFNDAASQFRKQQADLLRKQQAPSPTPNATPNVAPLPNSAAPN